MVATVGSVRAVFEADMRRYTAELVNGEKRTKKTVSAIQRDVERLKRIGELAATFGKSLFAGLAAGATVRQLTEVAKSIATIGDRARQAGLDASSFQKISFVAEQNRIEVDDLTSGIREMQLRMDEFIVSLGKSGSGAEALQRLGYTVDELGDKLKNPLELFTEIVGRIGQFDKAAQIRLFDEIFGGDGERLIRVLDQGEDGIRAMVKQAEDLGLILSDDVIAKAAELDRQFNVIANTVGSALKRAIVDAAGALQSFIDSFRSFENQQGATLSSELAEIGRQRLDLENKILKLRGEQRDSGMNLFGRDYESDIAYLQAERDALGETEAQILTVVEARRKAQETPTTTPATTWTPPAYVAPNADRDKAAKSAAREAQAVRDLIAELERELALVGATTLERETSNALREAGAAATAGQREQIVSLTAAIHDQTAAHETGLEAATFFASTMSDAFMSIVPAIETGNDALDNLLNSLLQAVAQAALLGQGPLAGLFGTAAGGANAGGLLGSLFGAVLHQGGDAASARTFRPIASLPRFHSGKSGIGHGELMAVLEDTESVLTGGQVRRTADALGAAGARLQDGGGVRVVVGIEDTGGLNLMPTVRAVSQEESAKASARVAQAVPSIAANATEEGRSRRIRPLSF